jgi:RecA-family ATPase
MSDPGKPLQLKELSTKVFTQAPFIIGDGLLNQKAVMVVGGPPKSFKSFLVNTIAYHLTTGTPLFSHFESHHVYFPIPRAVRVLVLEQEIGEVDLQLRLNQLLGEVHSDHQERMKENLWSHSDDDRVKLDTIAGRTHAAELIAYVKPEVVVLDPLVEFHGGDENSSRDMANLLRNLDWLRHRFNFATIIVHHTSKPNDASFMRQGPEMLRGSSVLHGKADTFLMLHCQHDAPPQLKVRYTMRRGRPIPPMILRADDSCLFRFQGWDKESSKVMAGVGKPN